MGKYPVIQGRQETFNKGVTRSFEVSNCDFAYLPKEQRTPTFNIH